MGDWLGLGPNLSFVTPLAFLLLVPVVLALVWRWWRRGQDRATLQFSSIASLRLSSPTFRARVAELPALLLALGLVLAIIALARPQRADTKTKRNVEGIDIIMVLDVSDSMLIEDMNPNRLEASKRIMIDFVKKRQSDRIGLIVFSGESYTRVPLTLDYGVLIKSIETVKIDRAVKMGTALGVSLANGVARLRDSTARSRVMIFLTDGENNSGTIDPETALEIAKGYGIKLYTIGAGRDGDAKLPVERTDAFGRKVKTYQPIHSKVNDELLGKMAQETGGKYFRATEEAALRRVFDDIDRLEKSKVDVSEFTKYAELYPRWLNFGVGLMLLGLALSLTWLRRRP